MALIDNILHKEMFISTIQREEKNQKWHEINKNNEDVQLYSKK